MLCDSSAPLIDLSKNLPLNSSSAEIVIESPSKTIEDSRGSIFHRLSSELVYDDMVKEMTRFLERYAQHAEVNPDPQLAEGLILDMAERIPHLLNESRFFEETARELSVSGFLFPSEQQERLMSARESLGEETVVHLSLFYKTLERAIHVLIDGIESQGISYIMHESGKANKNMVQSLKRVLKLMSFGYREIGQHIPSDTSSVDTDEPMSAPNEDFSIIDEKECHDSEIEDIKFLFEQLEDDADHEELRQNLSRLIKTNLANMHIGLADPVLAVIDEEMSILDTKTPLKQLDFYLSAINKCVRALGRVFFHKSFLLLDDEGSLNEDQAKIA